MTEKIMSISKRNALLALGLIAALPFGGAQAQGEHGNHHSNSSAATQQAPETDAPESQPGATMKRDGMSHEGMDHDKMMQMHEQHMGSGQMGHGNMEQGQHQPDGTSSKSPKHDH